MRWVEDVYGSRAGGIFGLVSWGLAGLAGLDGLDVGDGLL